MNVGELQAQIPSATSFGDVTVENSEDDDSVNEEGQKIEENSQGNKVVAKEPKTEQELLFCKFCNFQALDLALYVAHVHKPSHIKKAADAYNIRLSKETTPSIFHCQDCLISCNGENAWNQHLLGQKHRKVLEKKSAQLAEQKQQLHVQAQMHVGGGPMKQNYYGNPHYKKPYEKIQRTVQQPSHIPSQALGAKDFANYAAPLIGLEYVTEIQVIGQSPRYQCSLCDAKFDHNLKFPHLVGAKHRMNVLKIKRPNFLQDHRNQTQKRSELTAMLLREARKLEEEEGRRQVKTKVEKSPFNAVNASPEAPTGFGGITRGGSTPRGIRGARGGRGMMTRGNRGNRGTSSRGYRGTSRGRGKTWSEPHSSYDDTQKNYGYQYSGYSAPQVVQHSQHYDYGTMPYNESYDNYDHQLDDYGRSFDRPILQEPLHSGSPDRVLAPLSHSIPPLSAAPKAETPKKEESHKPDLSAGLAGALGDLTKLVQNEDDASVALHVSNALTQALLQYRMVNIQDEGSS